MERRRLAKAATGAAVLIAAVLVPLGKAPPAKANQQIQADVALVVSIDVSESVDEARYRLQMSGIADALSDPGVIATITSGPSKAIAFSMVAWADKAEIAVPWTRISNTAEALAVADRVRHLRRYGGEFTCLARMFQFLQDEFLTEAPIPASRTVIDVSGDGTDNCSEDTVTAQRRDALVKAGVTINGLPIIEDPERIVGGGAYRAPGSPMGNIRPLEATEQYTLERWYGTFVMGGDLAFILPAHGYEDFARAMRRKFVAEITSAPRASKHASAD